MSRIQFGKIKTTKVEGSLTSHIEANMVEGVAVTPKRVRYEERIRVRNAKEEQEEFLRFSDFVHSSPNADLLSPEFRIEYSKQGQKEGYYYIVKCWSCLEYDD